MQPESSDHALDAAKAEIVRLKKLVEASKLINSSIEGEALYESILTVAKGELGVERGSLFFVDRPKGEVWAKIAPEAGVSEIRVALGQGLAGTVAATGESVIIHDAYADSRFDRAMDLRSGFRTRSILCAPIRNRESHIVGVLQLLNKRDGEFGQNDLDFLEGLSEHMAIAMENAVLHLSLVAKNRMERELQLGRQIQARLLPEPPADIAGARLTARCVSCYEVSGDFYDFIQLPAGEIGIALGDVSGKGVGAALLTASLQAALRISAPIEPDLGLLAQRLNAMLHKMTGARKYVTLFFGRYQPATGTLRYVNAGHVPPVVCSRESVETLLTTGTPIGLLPDVEFGEETTIIPRGARLYIYSDGFSEAMTPEEEDLGMERWTRILQDATGQPFADLQDRLFDSIARFEGGAPPGDDKTLVILGRDPQ